MFFDQFLLFLWKEFRMQRSIWGICLAVGLLLEVVSHWYFSTPAIMVPMIVPVFYAMACGATLFAYERETRTSGWLLALSGNPAPLLTAKLTFAIFSTLILQILLAISEVGFQAATPEYFRADYRIIGTLFVPFALLQLSWAILGSLLSRRSLFSIGAMFFWQCILIVAPASLLLHLMSDEARMREQGFWYIYIGSHIVVVLADLWLGWRWCQGKYVDGTLLELVQQRLNQLSGEPRLTISFRQRLPRNAEYDRDWKRSWQRLVWQERHRESLHWFILAIGCIAGPLLILMDTVVLRLPPGSAGVTILVMFGCLATPVMIGVLAFETDPDQQQLRFLSGRGVNPTSLWLAKQVVWLPRAVVITMVASLVCWVSYFQSTNLMGQGDELRRMMTTRSALPLFFASFWFILLGYACGQLASVFFKRSIVAMIVGLALGFFVDFWVSVAITAPISLTPYLWIVFISMMLISLWQMRARMSEQPVWSKRLQFLTMSIGMLFGAALTMSFVAA